jgi:aminotransferase
MEHLVNPRVRAIQISGIRKFSNLVSHYPDALSLTIGQPDFPTPAHIGEAAKKAIDEKKTGYTHNAGLVELRQAASHFVREKYGLHYDGESEVIVTNGASEAIDITFRTILEEGTEVILPAPVYPGYEPIIRQCGAVPVYVDTRGTDFKLTAGQLEEALTEKTRCVVLPYPSNPTGQVLNREELKAIADVLSRRDVFVLSDEIYSELNYTDSHVSIATMGDLWEKTIVVNGLSKSHAMTGWRIGFTFAPATLTQHLLKVHQYNVACASSISQYAALQALTHGINDAAPMKEEYRRRRDYVYNRLVGMGMETVKPDGAFYLFPSIQRFGMSSFAFAEKLLADARVAVVPGDAFSSYGEGYIRISYACSMEILEQAMDRMETFVRGLA